MVVIFSLVFLLLHGMELSEVVVIGELIGKKCERNENLSCKFVNSFVSFSTPASELFQLSKDILLRLTVAEGKWHNF